MARNEFTTLSAEMELNNHSNGMASRIVDQQSVYQIQRSTLIVASAALVVFIVVCFVANFLALFFYFGHHSNSLMQQQEGA